MTPISALSDSALLDETIKLAACERSATASLIRALAEVDERRLYLSQGFSCMFYYCTRVLHLSEHGAYRRIEVARASRLFPSILDALTDGALTLTTSLLLLPHLTAENERELLQSARFKTKREVESLLAGRAPDTDAGARYAMHFTFDEASYDEFLHARALLRHQIPDGDTATIFKRALRVLIANVERTKLGVVNHPRTRRAAAAPHSRHLPAEVRRAVWRRDGAQCVFQGPEGRCPERDFLEFHHVRPFAEGGGSTVDNIELRCRAHNAYEADLYFGEHLTTTSAGA